MHEVREGDVCRAPHGAGACGVASEDIPAARASVSHGVLGASLRAAYVEEDTPLFTAIRWRWGETAGHGCETPLLDVGLDEDEARLSEVDVHGARPVGAHGWEEVLRFETVGDVLELLAVAGEEEGSSAGAVTDADYVALDVLRSVGCGGERLVVAALAGGCVGDGVFVPACGG